MYIQVAVPGPFLTPLTYQLPDRIDSSNASGSFISPVVGGRVWVSFRNKSIVGIVMALKTQIDCDAAKIKPIESVLDATPIFSESEMTLLNWASFYYHEPIGNVMQTALPKRLRQGEAVEVSGIGAWQLTDSGQSDNLPISTRAKQQLAIIALLKDAVKPQTAETFNAALNNWRQPLKRLIEQGWVEEVERLCLPEMTEITRPGHVLNTQQQSAVDRVNEVIETKEFGAFLLEGITGSGKTEVYLGMIEQVLAQGKQALVLVPEIGLTPQTVQRFEAYLQQPVAVMHSGLNDKERHCAWSLIKNNQVSVLLGTRSAIFTPFANLGLCIMDEEHDLSFKQQDGFRYSARDCLVRRAHLAKVPVVLGTATPSFESLHNALSGRYQHLKLTQRAGNAHLPSVRLLDIRGEKMAEGVSRNLKKQMETHIAAGGQVLLFLNRRGFAPVLMCHECGWQAACPSCDANMTFHQQFNELRCHHCGHQHKAPAECPDCGEAEFIKVGQGTERLESVVQTWFPEETILRVDRDTTRLKGQINELTQKAKEGKASILIGTQMLAKGHHFPNVTLVGLLDIDQGLFGADFRSAERMAQLIVQVSGRAGRAEKKGEVLIQTHQPEHPLLKLLVKEGYAAFALSALKTREQAELPPYEYQILIRAEANDPHAGWHFLNEIKQLLNGVKPSLLDSLPLAQTQNLEWAALGPVSAPMLRRQGRFRYQLLMQSNQRAQLHQWLGAVESQIYASKLGRQVRWNIDIDPQEMN